MTRARGAVLAATVALSCAAKPPPPVETRFVDVAKGIGHATFSIGKGTAGAFSGHAFEIDLDDARLHVAPAGSATTREKVATIAAQWPEAVGVNASFFDEDGRAMGLAVDDGRLIAIHKQELWAALLVDKTPAGPRARIVKGSEIGDELSHALVIQGQPRLVVAGVVPKLKEQTAERTAVCAADDKVVLVVSTAAEATAFATFLATPRAQGGLGCADAMNLDGGPSTQMISTLKAFASRMDGGWGVPIALVAVPDGVKAR